MYIQPYIYLYICISTRCLFEGIFSDICIFSMGNMNCYTSSHHIQFSVLIVCWAYVVDSIAYAIILSVIVILIK